MSSNFILPSPGSTRGIWTKLVLYVVLAGVTGTLWSSCASSRKSASGSAAAQLRPAAIRDIMHKVAYWQIDSIHHKGWRHPELTWTNGALFSGLMAYSLQADDSNIIYFLKNIGHEYNWQLNHSTRRYHADYYCVGQTYAKLYDIYHDPRMIADLRALADTLIARPHTESLEWKNNIGLREWAWCDALFMGPPSLAALAHSTGDLKYLDLVDKLWWKTADYLYDPKEHLFFRDGSFLHKKEKNGQKVFWSRGNGWVMGGLVQVLSNMPDDYAHRARWITLYKDMATRLAALQQPDGTWHASLLDPDSYPSKETSGTTFYCYALAWGINHGLLDRKTFAPVVRRAWTALVGCVQPNGMLGYVQYIAGSPGHVTADATEVYAVGAFLLAGTEMYKLTGGK